MQIPTVSVPRILLLVAFLVAFIPLSFLTISDTKAQTDSSAVSDAPALTLVSVGATAVELSWTLVSDAVSYELWTWWDGLADWQRVVDGSLAGTSYTHQGVTAGRKYFYIVAGVDSNGVRGPWSDRVSVTVPGSNALTSTPTSTPTSSATPMFTPISTPTPTPTLPLTATLTPTSTAAALSAPALRAEAGPGLITLTWGKGCERRQLHADFL